MADEITITTPEIEEATPETAEAEAVESPAVENAEAVETEAEAKAEEAAENAAEVRLQKIEKKLKAIASAIAMCRRTGVDPRPFLEEKEKLSREQRALQALSALKRIESDLLVIRDAGFEGIKLAGDAPTLVQTWPVAFSPTPSASPKAKAKPRARTSRDWLKFERWLSSSGASLILRDRVVALKDGQIEGLPPGQAVMREYNWPSANAWAVLKVILPSGEQSLAGVAYDKYVEG